MSLPSIAGLPSSLPRTSTSVRSAIFLWRFGTEDTPTRRARPPAQQSNTRKSPRTPTRSGHAETNEVFPGSAIARRADGRRARGRAPVAVGGDHLDRREDRLYRRA